VLGLLAEILTALSPKDVIGTIEGHDHRASNSRSASELMRHPEIETFVDELQRTQPSYEELVKRIEEMWLTLSAAVNADESYATRRDE
jgi:hypothetical protein